MKSFLVVCWLTVLFATACGDSAPCQPGGCDDGNACTLDTCDLVSGNCLNEPAADVLLCDAEGGPGVCVDGACSPQSCAGIVCDDENPCTVDACLEGAGICVGVAVPAMTTCEVDGAFGSCLGTECDFSLPPTGSAELALTIEDLSAAAVAYTFVCASDVTLSGSLTESEGRWTTSLTLPAGECGIELLVFDEGGEVVCDGQDTVTIQPAEVTTLTAVLTCNV